MTCINRFSNLGFSPYHYLVSSQKEKTFATSLCKTSLAIAFLVPGILVVLGCSLAKVFLAPCLKTKGISQQPSEKNSFKIPAASPKILKREIEKESPDASKEKKDENGSLKSFAPSEKSNAAIEQEGEQEFKALSLKLQTELSELCVGGFPLVLLEQERWYGGVYKKILEILGKERLCSTTLDEVLAQFVHDHKVKKIIKRDWGAFRVICEDTTSFLDAYEKAFGCYQFDRPIEALFQRWNETLCTTMVKIWTHAKNIAQLMDQEEMKALAEQILVRWQALSAKKIVISVEAPPADQ